GSKNPQPPARAGDPPAGFVAMKYRCLAQFGRDGVVLGLDFASEPIQCLGKPAGTQLQAKAIVQDGTGFSHRESLCLVEISGESQGAGSELGAGSAGGQRHLQRMAGTDILTTPGTGGLVSNQPCHMRTHRRNVFDKLFELQLINKLLSSAVRTSTELNFNALIDMIGVVAEGSAMSVLASRSLGLYEALFFFNTERSSLPVGRHARPLGALLPTGRCAWFEFRAADGA